ncbi:MAG: hypothetical protein QM757_03835 [Paludibaculum sp.]
MQILGKRYGKKNVIREENFVDIKLKKPDGVTYIEIKSDAQAHRAVREALGQLLEYAYFRRPPSEFPNRLAIIAPGPTSPEFEEYLERLSKLCQLNLTYRTFTLDSADLDL